MIDHSHQSSWIGARQAGSSQRNEVSYSWAQPPRYLWTFVKGRTATSVMEERKLRLEVVSRWPSATCVSDEIPNGYLFLCHTRVGGRKMAATRKFCCRFF